MEYLADYYKENKMITKVFPSFNDLLEYNTNNSTKHYNLSIEYSLQEVVSSGGLIVCVEGDENLYDEDLGDFLQTQENYRLFNNIYEDYEKLKELKGKQVDLLVVQSTGIMVDQINYLMKWYLGNELPLPKNILCVFGDEDEFLGSLMTEDTKIFDKPDISDGKLFFRRWVGAGYKEVE